MYYVALFTFLFNQLEAFSWKWEVGGLFLPSKSPLEASLVSTHPHPHLHTIFTYPLCPARTQG